MHPWTIATLCLPVVSLIFGFFIGHVMNKKSCYYAGRLVLLSAGVLFVLLNPYLSVVHNFLQATDPDVAARAMFYHVLVFAIGAGFLFGGWLCSQFENLKKLT